MNRKRYPKTNPNLPPDAINLRLIELLRVHGRINCCQNDNVRLTETSQHTLCTYCFGLLSTRQKYTRYIKVHTHTILFRPRDNKDFCKTCGVPTTSEKSILICKLCYSFISHYLDSLTPVQFACFLYNRQVDQLPIERRVKFYR